MVSSVSTLIAAGRGGHRDQSDRGDQSPPSSGAHLHLRHDDSRRQGC